jgi:hypothetical protein
MIMMLGNREYEGVKMLRVDCDGGSGGDGSCSSRISSGGGRGLSGVNFCGKGGYDTDGDCCWNRV